MRRRPFLVASVALAALALAATVHAQFGRGRMFARIATPADFDGRFQFCRIVFRNAPTGDGGGWGVDYPQADENLSIRLAELTRTPVSFAAANAPNHALVRFTDPELFQCPFVMMTEPGGAFLDQDEADALRTYVLKGGFLWADDFWGEYAFRHWEAQLRKALPIADYPIFELPPEHPLLNAQFVTKVVQIPSIGWAFNGRTSERGADSAVPHARGIADRNGRLMVLMTHNTDYGDSWEREGDDPRYFYAFGPDGYAFGINAVLYALTH
ncbi:MAG: DUF4159 domain-containing protein [Vicinamibacterales bacterium]